ncbi:MAG: exonuclease domain-containing protein [Calditrichia bacterium]
MFAIIDLETTGLDPGTDRIFEIAILQFDGHQLTDSFLHPRQPGISIAAGIERLTGLMTNNCIGRSKFSKSPEKLSN